MNKEAIEKLPFVSLRGVRYVELEALLALLPKEDERSESELVGVVSERGNQPKAGKRSEQL